MILPPPLYFSGTFIRGRQALSTLFKTFFQIISKYFCLTLLWLTKLIFWKKKKKMSIYLKNSQKSVTSNTVDSTLNKKSVNDSY